MNPPLVADTGGLLRALARTAHGEAIFPEYEAALTSASRVIVPGLVLAEVDYFLREDRRAMRKLAAGSLAVLVLTLPGAAQALSKCAAKADQSIRAAGLAPGASLLGAAFALVNTNRVRLARRSDAH